MSIVYATTPLSRRALLRKTQERPGPTAVFRFFTKLPFELRCMVYNYARPRTIVVHNLDNKLVPIKHVIPITLHIWQESRHYTLSFYLNFGLHLYQPTTKLFGLSSTWYDPEQDTVFLSETFELDGWVKENAIDVSGDFHSFYRSGMVLRIRGEDLSNIRHLKVFDSIHPAYPEMVAGPKGTPKVMYLGLFKNLATYTQLIRASESKEEFEQDSEEDRLAIKGFYKKFKALELVTDDSLPDDGEYLYDDVESEEGIDSDNDEDDGEDNGDEEDTVDDEEPLLPKVSFKRWKDDK